MAYTLTQAIANVRYLLNETSSVFWSDAEIQGWIAEGVVDLSTKLLCVVEQDQLSITSGNAIYTPLTDAWLADCLMPKSVWYTDSDGDLVSLQLIRGQQMGHTDARDGEPKYYYFESAMRTFFIQPEPSASGVIEVVYATQTDDFTELGTEHQPLAWLYATYKARLKERMYQDALFLYQQYLASLQFERQDKYDLGIEPTAEFQVP